MGARRHNQEAPPARRLSRREPWLVTVVVGALWVMAGALLLPLIVGVVGGRAGPADGASPGAPEIAGAIGPLIVNTLLCALAVAVLATVVGFAVAWFIGRRRSWWVGAMVMLPLVLPPYLAYAGWGVLRAPKTAIGDWIGSLPGERAGDVGHAVGVTLAIMGLALWAWPLAAIIIGASIRRLDADLLVMLDHETRGKARRAAMRMRLVAPAILVSICLTGLLVCGTAIPLHLANVPTLAINVWLMLDRSPPDQAWRAYAAAWPLWLLACAAAWWLGGKVVTWGTGQRVNSPEPAQAAGRFGFLASVLPVLGVVLLSVVAPAALLIWSVRDVSSIARFWTISGDAVIHGALVAAATGTIVVLIGAMVSIGLGTWPKPSWGAATLVRVTIFLGLAPGVLVGSGLVTGWNRLDPTGVIASSVAIEVIAHVARFGWLGAITGCVLVRLEHPSLRDLRRLDGGGTLRSYARTTLAIDAPVLAGAGLATAFLSMTEIEASVVVAIPGPGNLARQILNYLHFARLEEMSAAAFWIVTSGILSVLVVGWLSGLRASLERSRASSP